MHVKNKQPLPAVTLAAIGVVYGDIGTSPLYTLRECLTAEEGITMTPASIYGFLSLIFWLLTLVVSIKYVCFVMRADNDGEGDPDADVAGDPQPGCALGAGSGADRTGGRQLLLW